MKRWLRERGGRAARRLPGLALAAAVALAGAGCASLGLGAEPIEVNLVGLTPLPSTAFEHRLRVDLRLRNPNPRAYRIDGLRFRLLVNGERLASGQAEVEAELPRLGEVVVPVTTTTTLLDLVNQIVHFGARSEAEQRQLDYELTGRIFLAGSWGGIDFERRGSTIELEQARKPAR
jgi:LEA14-like dessication related protein